MKININSNYEKSLPELEVFYDEFLQKRTSELDILQTALLSKNLSVVANLSHQWKGFCAPYGFGKLATLAIELEKKLESSELEHCFDILTEMKSYLESKTRPLNS